MSKYQKTWLGVWIAAAVIVVIAVSIRLLDKAFFGDEDQLSRMHQECLQLKPGVTLAELEEKFGPYVENEPTLFGPYEYSVLYSAPISAELDDAGNVISLSCDEGNYAFRKNI